MSCEFVISSLFILSASPFATHLSCPALIDNNKISILFYSLAIETFASQTVAFTLLLVLSILSRKIAQNANMEPKSKTLNV
jgi:hypothetical protein